ncbi:phage regulatory CII family protein [Pseudomonas sp. RL_15y_Pfl2_60]|uniref:phage regulatory CII family protein n=1 Tax=Pseudomonas sp. RL_15y_Pfl2_60 TaxID=3088709 RepID=UPI0030D98251
MSRRDLLPDAGPVLNLRQALYRASRDYHGGQNSLALDLGIPADELGKRLSPKDNRPIKPELIEEIVGLTGDPRLLDALTRPAGAVWFRPKAVEASGDAMKALGAFLHEEGEFVGSLHSGAADNKWEQHEVVLLEQHGYHLVARILGMMAGARIAMEGADHG